MSPSAAGRVALLDDHPAVLDELVKLVTADPELSLVGTAVSEGQLWRLIVRQHPDVVVLDLHHRGRDGIGLCFDIKRWPYAPAVAIYAGHVDDAIVIAAALAGAGAVIGKSSGAAAVLEAIRELARYPRALVQIPAPFGREMAARLDPVDHRILAMRLAGDHPVKIARALELPPSAVSARIENMIARLEARRAA